MSDEATAKRRLLQLTAVRLAGIVVAFVGLVVLATDRLGPPKIGLGAVLVLIGFAFTLFVPLWLLRRWRGR